MPLETATYINQLVVTNPVSTDGMAQGDDHLRLIKNTLVTSFPNIGAAVTATDADLNGTAGLFSNGVLTVKPASGATTTGGKVILKGAGANPDITLTNVSGTLQAAIGATSILSISGTGNTTVAGWLTATVLKQAANTLLPTGCIIAWAGSIAAIPAGWALCNGAGGTPDLRDRFVLGAGGGYVPSQTGGAAAVSATTATGGSHNHTGITGAGGSHGHAAYTDTQGSHAHAAATAGHALTVSEIPSHDHNLGGAGVVYFQGGGGSLSMNTGGMEGFITAAAQGGNAAHTHGISADGSHVHNIGVPVAADHVHILATDAGHQHTVSVWTVPPFYALAYLMKL